MAKYPKKSDDNTVEKIINKTMLRKISKSIFFNRILFSKKGAKNLCDIERIELIIKIHL
jgi:hypothetical protein